LSGGFLLWSLATAASGLVGGVGLLVLLRLAMGVGEATFYPSALSLLSRGVPPLQRARATATMQLGGVLGPAIGTIAGGFIMARYGWRAMFVVMGLASLTWLVAWRFWMRRAPHARSSRRCARAAPT
jgi:MFS family permease